MRIGEQSVRLAGIGDGANVEFSDARARVSICERIQSMLRLAATALLPYCLLAQPLVDYERQVHPILAAKCWSRHSQEKRSGGLSLANHSGGRGAAIQPGSAATSLLVRRVNGDVQPRMPIENPVPVEDLHAIIYHALGIPPTQSFVVEKRPVYVTKDGKGRVIQEIFS